MFGRRRYYYITAHRVRQGRSAVKCVMGPHSALAVGPAAVTQCDVYAAPTGCACALDLARPRVCSHATVSAPADGGALARSLARMHTQTLRYLRQPWRPLISCRLIYPERASE